MSRCAWLRDREAEALTLRAFKQACDEAGIPPHPGGKCPAPDCNCRDFADQVEARAIEIIEGQIGPLPPDRCVCGPGSTRREPRLPARLPGPRCRCALRPRRVGHRGGAVLMSTITVTMTREEAPEPARVAS